MYLSMTVSDKGDDQCNRAHLTEGSLLWREAQCPKWCGEKPLAQLQTDDCTSLFREIFRGLCAQ